MTSMACTAPALLWHVKDREKQRKAGSANRCCWRGKDVDCVNRSITQPHLVSDRFVYNWANNKVCHTALDLMVHRLWIAVSLSTWGWWDVLIDWNWAVDTQVRVLPSVALTIVGYWGKYFFPSIINWKSSFIDRGGARCCRGSAQT